MSWLSRTGREEREVSGDGLEVANLEVLERTGLIFGKNFPGHLNVKGNIVDSDITVKGNVCANAVVRSPVDSEGSVRVTGSSWDDRKNENCSCNAAQITAKGPIIITSNDPVVDSTLKSDAYIVCNGTNMRSKFKAPHIFHNITSGEVGLSARQQEQEGSDQGIIIFTVAKSVGDQRNYDYFQLQDFFKRHKEYSIAHNDPVLGHVLPSTDEKAVSIRLHGENDLTRLTTLMQQEGFAIEGLEKIKLPIRSGNSPARPSTGLGA